MTISATPAFFADFTLEGQPNGYLLNKKTYSTAAAWLADLGGTLSQAGTPYYTNSSGFLAQAAANTLRFDYDPVTHVAKGLLLEPASTNLDLQSQTFTNAYWTQNNGTATAAAGTAPDNTNTASKFAEDNTNGVHFLYNSGGVSVASSTIYTFSCYLKYSGRQWVALDFANAGVADHLVYFDIQNGVVGNADGACTGTIKNVGNGWYRCSVTRTTGNTETSSFTAIDLSNSNNGTGSAPSYQGDGVSGVLVWGAQLEALSYASSYIPTTSTTQSRAADNLTATPISSWYNSVNGVVYAAGDTFSPGTNQPALITIDDGTTNNNFALLAAGSGNLAVVSTGGAAKVATTTDSGQSGVAANTLTRMAISTIASNFLFDRDGGTVDQFNTTQGMPVSPTTLRIGSYNGLSLVQSGHITQIGYWGTTFTNAQLQDLTTNGYTIVPGPVGPLVDTTLTKGRYFSRRDYAYWLDKITSEDAAAREEYERFVNSVEAERNLTPTQRADLDFHFAQFDLDESEEKLFGNLTTTNHIKFSQAKEKLDAARKAREHEYYMDIVNKEWAKQKERRH